MTTKSINFETDDDIEVAVTLSNSNRLSLSDITQATIGNLSEWADNCDTASDTGGNVLRPWEDNSETDNADYLSKTDNSQQEITKRPPPSYQEHIKRHLEDDAEDDRSKRQRIDSSTFNQIPAAINTFYQKNSEMCNDRRITHNSQKNIQSHDVKQFRYTNNQTVARNAQSTLNMNNTNTTVLPTNSPQQRPQSFENRKQQQPTMNIIMPPNQNSNARQQNYLPWMNSPMPINQTKVDKQVQQTYLSPAVNQNVQQVQIVADQTSGIHFQQCLVTHQVQTIQPQLFQPFLIPPQNDTDFQSRGLPVFDMPALQSSLVYTHPQQKMTDSQSNFLLDNRIPNMVPKVVQQCEPIVNTSTSNQLMSKVMNTVSNISETNETAFNLKHLQAAIGCDDNTINENYAVKDEPKTPIGKLGNHSTFDSPGMDSRFTESLYNLLGSPPPDSPMSKNPILGDLHALLNRECKKEIIPQSLFGMQGSNNEAVKKENVFERERNLQDRFSTLQSKNPEEVRQLSSMFRYQSALIETDRFRTLHESQYPGPYKESVNRHHDNQLHKVMDRVERSIQLLETSNKENQAKKSTKFRPHLSKESIRLMENWYKQNLSHPYPTSHVIEMLAQAGNIGVEQVKKWFANKRNRNSNTRSLTEIAMQKRKLGQMPGQC